MLGRGKVELLSQVTLDKYNVTVKELSPNSNQKVEVRCTECGEQFSREFRNLGQFHMCSTHVVADNVGKKWCGVCHRFLPNDEFSPNESRYDGTMACCIKCTKGSCSDGYLVSAMKQTMSRCEPNGIPFDLDLAYLHQLYEKQNGKCHFTKLPFRIHGNLNVSIHTLDPEVGYVKDNVVLVCSGLSTISSGANSDIAAIVEIINALSQSVRLEAKLGEGSALPYRKRTTDAGYDLFSTTEAIINPGEMVNIETGAIVSPPEGTYYSIEGRSSLWMIGIVPARGIVDATYQGPLSVALVNNSKVPFKVNIGDKIAQLILHKIIHADFAIVDEFSPVQEGRGKAGFGSSGR